MEKLSVYSIRKQFQTKVIEVKLNGITNLNVLNIGIIRQSLLNLVKDRYTNVLLNAQSVKFIDSSAIDCLNQVSKVAKLNHSSITLTEVSSELMEIINLVKQHSRLEINNIQPASIESKVA